MLACRTELACFGVMFQRGTIVTKEIAEVPMCHPEKKKRELIVHFLEVNHKHTRMLSLIMLLVNVFNSTSSLARSAWFFAKVSSSYCTSNSASSIILGRFTSFSSYAPSKIWYNEGSRVWWICWMQSWNVEGQCTMIWISLSRVNTGASYFF